MNSYTSSPNLHIFLCDVYLKNASLVSFTFFITPTSSNIFLLLFPFFLFIILLFFSLLWISECFFSFSYYDNVFNYFWILLSSLFNWFAFFKIVFPSNSFLNRKLQAGLYIITMSMASVQMRSILYFHNIRNLQLEDAILLPWSQIILVSPGSKCKK